jgi:hypothetical protein
MTTTRTGAISESGVVFFSAGGHDHDGQNSTIINTSKYSIFDFSFGLVGTNQDRLNTQTINQNGFKNYIIQTVNESVLEPAGVVLQDNIINSRNIIAGSITSTEIAANTITGNNIAAQTITGNNIVSNTITSTQIAANTITGNNIAAGTITADKLSVGAIDAGSVTIIYPNSVPTGDFWSNTGSFRLGGTAGINYTPGSGDITFGSNITINGSVTSTGTITGGNVSGVKLSGSTGEIGGWDILSTRLDGGASTLYSNGTIQGDLFRTGSSGARIEMGDGAGVNNEVYMYYSSTGYVSIRAFGTSGTMRVSTPSTYDFEGARFRCGEEASFGGDIYPVSAGNCGTSSDPWDAVYATNTTIQSSDERLKTDIKDIPLGLDFINELNPVSYKWKEVRLPNTKEDKQAFSDNDTPLPIRTRPGVREHYGLIAQEFKNTMDQFNIDNFAGWCLENPEDPQSKQMLGYVELIPVLIKAVQELSNKLDALEEKI